MERRADGKSRIAEGIADRRADDTRSVPTALGKSALGGGGVLFTSTARSLAFFEVFLEILLGFCAPQRLAIQRWLGRRAGLVQNLNRADPSNGGHEVKVEPVFYRENATTG